MCGIAGFVGSGDRRDLEAMTDALVHRGPDACGYHVDPSRRLHFGHRRLSIRDLSGGGQPMWSRDGALCVIYNGEIFNFEELREQLEAAGHRFETSHSDTEVVRGHMNLQGGGIWRDGAGYRGMRAFWAFRRRVV